MPHIDLITDIWYPDIVRLLISDTDTNPYQPMLIYVVVELACH